VALLRGGVFPKNPCGRSHLDVHDVYGQLS
jgi:hypothetical protein